MNDCWWYFSRATGIVATVLAVAVAGVRLLLLGARTPGARKSPALVARPAQLPRRAGAGLHRRPCRWPSYLDTTRASASCRCSCPGTAHWQRRGRSLGACIATYLFAMTVFTSWPQARFSRPGGAMLHLTSVARRRARRGPRVADGLGCGHCGVPRRLRCSVSPSACMPWRPADRRRGAIAAGTDSQLALTSAEPVSTAGRWLCS